MVPKQDDQDPDPEGEGIGDLVQGLGIDLDIIGDHDQGPEEDQGPDQNSLGRDDQNQETNVAGQKIAKEAVQDHNPKVNVLRDQDPGEGLDLSQSQGLEGTNPGLQGNLKTRIRRKKKIGRVKIK